MKSSVQQLNETVRKLDELKSKILAEKKKRDEEKARKKEDDKKFRDGTPDDSDDEDEYVNLVSHVSILMNNF